MSKEMLNAIDKVSSGTYSDDSGRVCEFYRVSDLVGAKVYRDAIVGRNNMESQQSLHKLGFAPEVLSGLVKCVNGHEKRWLFLTELATTVQEICNQDCLEECICNLPSDCCQCYMGINFHKHDQFSEIGDLFDKLTGLGIKDDDQHWGNYGYLEDGTAVVIDCEFYHNSMCNCMDD